MTSLPPKIDQRTYEEIVQQTEILAEDFTNSLEQGWKVAPLEQMDLGRALIRIFGRLVTKVSDRLNQVPEKNFLAFLDLIGGQLQPPQPAKVPLTFYLAEASPVGSLVPVHTQISAPPLEGNDEEIIFETEQELIVTTAQLKAVFVQKPSQNKYGDYTLSAVGKQEQSFPIFLGDRPIDHSLYITCPEIFNLPELSNFILTIETNNPQSIANLSLDWSYWNGQGWQNLSSPSSTIAENQCILNFVNIKVPAVSEINGKSEKWLQAKLNSSPDLSLIINEIKGSTQINQANLLSEVCLYNDTPLDQSKDFSPFGEEPQLNDTFYIALHDTFVKPNANITLTFELSHIPNLQSSDITITWEIEEQGEWKAIVTKESENQVWMNSSPQLIKNSPMTTILKFPQQVPLPSTVNGETRYWIRARITKGFYGQASTIRKYAIYNEVAIVDSDIVTNSKTISIVGTASDFFKAGDIIRLVWLDTNTEKREEYEIESLDNLNHENLNLKKPTSSKDTVPKGTKIFLRYVMSETIPPTYDPPIIKSLKLSYNFDFNEESTYFAYNNFHYSQPQKFDTKLTAKIEKGNQKISLNQVEGLTVGEFLTFSSENNPEIHQIEYINPESNQLILAESVNQTYSKDTPIYCYFRPFIPTIDKNPSLYLGFDKPFGNQTVTLYVQVNPPSPEELSQAITRSNPQLIWEYFSPLGWQTLGVNDETKAFSHRGLVQFIAPSDFTKSTIFNQDLYWLRVRWQGGNFSIQPRLNRILTNTTWAVQATTIQEEILGSSNYEAHQTFTARYSPILIGERLEIRENKIPEKLNSDRLIVIRDDLGEIEEIWVTWQAVPDFYSSTESDRHYLLDRQTGQIHFGDGQAGMIPPRGRNNIRLSFYRVGGGEQGNLVIVQSSEEVNQ
jgi:uncharacterized protein YqfB (UPF0267 family)